MSSSQASAVAKVVGRSLAVKVEAALASFKPPQVPASSAGCARLRAQRDTQRRMRMHQLRTGS